MEHLQIPKPKNYELSDELLDFCERNGISETDLDNIANSELAKNANRKEFNPILIDYPVEMPNPVTDEIYIRDIIGEIPNEGCRNVLNALNVSYQNRKEPLKMSKEEMLKSIKSSFDYEPICLAEVKYGKYMVTHNGCHRVTMLRLLYIDEVLKGEKPIEEIDEKYSIKAEIKNYDLTLTYINYLLSKTGAIKGIRSGYNNDPKKKPKYRILYANGIESALTREEIIFNFNDLFEQTKSNISEYSLANIEGYAKAIPSLNSFLKIYAPELAQKNELGGY